MGFICFELNSKFSVFDNDFIKSFNDFILFSIDLFLALATTSIFLDGGTFNSDRIVLIAVTISLKSDI